jgi:hypothetical protein
MPLTQSGGSRRRASQEFCRNYLLGCFILFNDSPNARFLFAKEMIKPNLTLLFYISDIVCGSPYLSKKGIRRHLLLLCEPSSTSTSPLPETSPGKALVVLQLRIFSSIDELVWRHGSLRRQWRSHRPLLRRCRGALACRMSCGGCLRRGQLDPT